jgi:hypothetical protein
MFVMDEMTDRALHCFTHHSLRNTLGDLNILGWNFEGVCSQREVISFGCRKLSLMYESVPSFCCQV